MDKIFIFCCFCAVVCKMLTVTNAKTIKKGGVNKQEKQEIVKIHNELRLLLANNKVPNQPRATNMKEMCWDDHLAKEAQKHANTMLFSHKKPEDKRWTAGQNLAIQASTVDEDKPKWEHVVKDWYKEVKDYTYGTSSSKYVTGHYTQVVWAKSFYIGCGYTYYIDEEEKHKYRKLYVCNYGPGGNVQGQLPYKTGKCGCKGLCKTIECKKGRRLHQKNDQTEISSRFDDLFSIIYRFFD